MKIKIIAQRYENYNDSPGEPFWKQKGLSTFEIDEKVLTSDELEMIFYLS